MHEVAASAATQNIGRPIVFIGMMGSGKTTIGRSVAKKLGLKFVDNDAEIARRTGKKAGDVLRDDEQKFRDLEEQIIEELLSTGDVFVYSLGGGSILRETTRQRLKKHATVVWLSTDPTLLSRRVAKRLMDRPMLDGDPDERMRTLLADREPLYRDLADKTFDSGNGSREKVAARIAEVFA